MPPSGMWIHGLGLMTPLGERPAAVAAAVRAGLSRRGESPCLNHNGDPMVVSQVPDDALLPLAAALADRPAAHRRLLRLATRALQQAIAHLPDPPEIPLLLALPESHPKLPPFAPGSLLADLRIQCEVPLALTSSALTYSGRAGALAALADAFARPHDPRSPFVLVGGLDSSLDPELLAALDHDRRVMAVGVRNGFAPGEGAAFLLLSQRQILPGSRARIHVSRPALGHEPGHRHGDAPLQGDGLADALREALRGRPAASIRSVYAGLNGEQDGAREWGVAALRNREALADDLQLEHPASSLGDPGAAMAATWLALIATGLERGYCGGPALVWCANDGPLRAAAIVEDRPAPETT